MTTLNSTQYAKQDDFKSAARFIASAAASNIREANGVVSRAGFFRRRKLMKTFSVSVTMCELLLLPPGQKSVPDLENMAVAEAYLRTAGETVRKFSSAALDARRDAQPAIALMYKVLEPIVAGTCKYLTRTTHAECWFGSEQMANDLDFMETWLRERTGSTF